MISRATRVSSDSDFDLSARVFTYSAGVVAAGLGLLAKINYLGGSLAEGVAWTPFSVFLMKNNSSFGYVANYAAGGGGGGGERGRGKSRF